MKRFGYAGIGLMLVLILAYFYLTMPVWSLHFIQGYLLILGLSVAALFVGAVQLKSGQTNKLLQVSGYATGAIVLVLVGGFIYSSPMFQWQTMRQLLPVETKTFSESVSNVDMANLVILDKTDAIKFSEKLLTEKNPALGSVFHISEAYGTLSVVDGKPYWVFPLEHSGFFKWLSNREVPGYLKVSATSGQSTFVEKPYSFAPSAYFSHDLKRSVYLKYPTIGLTDYSFEIDESGKPYWVITAYTHATGLTTSKVIGSVLVDAATGKDTFYAVGKQPKWIDRVYSLEVFEESLRNWGEYVKGWWNPSDSGKLKNTEGYGYVFNEGNIYFYTGITSKGADEATTGFMVFNPRDGKAAYYQLSGSTETKAVGLMEELVQNAGYKANFPYLINLNGEATYFSTLKGNSQNVVGYGFASVQNYRAVAWGKTLREAQTNYERALLREGGSGNSLSAQTNLAKTLSGEVSRVGLSTEGYYLIKLKGNNTYFTVAVDAFPAVALTQTGDKVTLKYLSTESLKLIDAIDFSNQSIE